MSDKELIADCYGSYVKMLCPHCDVTNWVYLGLMDDVSAMDREAMECWSCDKSSWLSENIKDDYGYESLDEAYIEKGTKTP